MATHTTIQTSGEPAPAAYQEAPVVMETMVHLYQPNKPIGYTSSSTRELFTTLIDVRRRFGRLLFFFWFAVDWTTNDLKDQSGTATLFGTYFPSLGEFCRIRRKQMLTPSYTLLWQVSCTSFFALFLSPQQTACLVQKTTRKWCNCFTAPVLQ